MEVPVLNSPTDPTRKDAKAERVQLVLAAALDEFADLGFASARLDSIAERAGVAKGTVYLYFENKEALFEEAVRSVIVPTIEHIETMVAKPEGSAEALLRAMIGTFYREVIGTDKKRVIRLLIGEGSRFPALLAFYHREVMSRGLAVLGTVMDYGVERGEFERNAAVRYPQIILAPGLVAALWKMLFDDFDSIDLDEYCDAHLDLVINGLKSRNMA
jgi:AcrR family transcriptional regulator